MESTLELFGVVSRTRLLAVKTYQFDTVRLFERHNRNNRCYTSRTFRRIFEGKVAISKNLKRHLSTRPIARETGVGIKLISLFVRKSLAPSIRKQSAFCDNFDNAIANTRLRLLRVRFRFKAPCADHQLVVCEDAYLVAFGSRRDYPDG